jgi:hypothetical protein
MDKSSPRVAGCPGRWRPLIHRGGRRAERLGGRRTGVTTVAMVDRTKVSKEQGGVAFWGRSQRKIHDAWMMPGKTGSDDTDYGCLVARIRSLTTGGPMDRSPPGLPGWITPTVEHCHDSGTCDDCDRCRPATDCIVSTGPSMIALWRGGATVSLVSSLASISTGDRPASGLARII